METESRLPHRRDAVATARPKCLDEFCLEGATDTAVKVEGPLGAIPTGVYYAGINCWLLVGLHI